MLFASARNAGQLIHAPTVDKPVISNGCRDAPVYAGTDGDSRLRHGCDRLHYHGLSARSVDRIALGYRYGAAQLGYFQNVTLHYDDILNASVPLHDEAVSSLSKLRNVALALSLTSLNFVSPAFECVAVTGVKCRGATARPEVGTRGPTTVHPCRERHRRCRRAHPGVATRLGGASGPMDAVGIFQRELPTFAVLAGIPFFATPHAIVTFCLFVPALIYAGNPLGIGAKDVLGAIGPQTAAALIAVAIGVTVQSAFLSDLSRLEGFVVSGLDLPDCIPRSDRGCFQGDRPLRLALSLLRDFSPTRFRWSPQPGRSLSNGTFRLTANGTSNADGVPECPKPQCIPSNWVGPDPSHR